MIFLCLKNGNGIVSFSQTRSLTFTTKAGEPTILVQTVGSLQQLSCLPRMPSMAISASQVKFCLYFFMQQNALLCVLDLYIMYIIKGVPKKVAYRVLKAILHNLPLAIYTDLEMIPLRIVLSYKD